MKSLGRKIIAFGALTALLAGNTVFAAGSIDLFLTKTVEGATTATVAQGDIATYRLNFGNDGPDIAHNVRVVDYYDSDRVFALFGLPENCQDDGKKLICTVGTLAPGESGSISYSGQLKSYATLGEKTTYARIDGNETDIDFLNNTAPITVNVSGGSGSGTGSGFTGKAAHLSLQNDVRDREGVWRVADVVSTAALINERDIQDTEFKLIVSNTGNTAAYDIQVKNIFLSETLTRENVRNVTGATWSAARQAFTIPRVDPNDTVSVSFVSTFSQKSSSGGLEGVTIASIVNAALTSTTALPGVGTITGLGEEDYAYFRTERATTISQPLPTTPTPTIPSPNVVSGQRGVFLEIDPSAVNIQAGQDVVFSMRVHNNTNNTYNNLTLRGLFPLQAVSLRDSRLGALDGREITWGKTTLAPGETWTNVVTMRTPASGNRSLRTFFTLTGAGLTTEEQYITTNLYTAGAVAPTTPAPTTPTPVPVVIPTGAGQLPQNGPALNFLLLLISFSAAAAWRLAKRV